MRHRLFMIWAALRWVLLMFLIAPAMEAPLVAHPHLPFGSLVRVVNARNGKFEVVRINDRGPYQEGREIDVSYRVARKSGLIHPGVSQVRLELMELPEKKH